MRQASTGVLLGFSLLVIHPSRVLPSKSKIQPSAFSFGVNSLSAAPAPTSLSAIARKGRIVFILTYILKTWAGTIRLKRPTFAVVGTHELVHLGGILYPLVCTIPLKPSARRSQRQHSQQHHLRKRAGVIEI